MIDFLRRVFNVDGISNRQKKIFFKTFIHQLFIEKGKNHESVLQIAANRARLDLNQVHEILNEVANYQWESLKKTKDSIIIAWFMRNSKKMAQLTENMIGQGSM